MRHFLFAIVLIVLMGCSERPSIYGIIHFPENSNYQHTVYLIQPQHLNELAAPFFGKVIDSAIIDDQGFFELKHLPQTSEPMLLEIAIQKQGDHLNYLQNDDPATNNYMVFVWEKDETIDITASAAAFQQTFSIENPSPVNTSLLTLREVKQNSFQKYLQNKHWEVHDGTQLMEKEEAVLNYQKTLIDFANNSTQFFPSMLALRWVSPQNDYERVPEFLFQQCEQWRDYNHPWANELCEKADKETLPVLVGDPFPNANLPLSTGEITSLYAHLGKKLTIVDVWASWCVPCRKENRDILVPLWEQYYEKGFQIIAYGLETSEEAWNTAIEKDGAYRWLHASDLQGDEAAFMKTLRIQTIPANFILDAEGKVIAKNLHGADLQRFVATYFQQ
ncbi:MAG: TlpA disulfide reductase family protein [Flavobacteriaceae bacterium]